MSVCKCDELKGTIAQLEDDIALLRKNNADLRQKLHDAEMRADLAEAACTEYREDYMKVVKALEARL